MPGRKMLLLSVLLLTAVSSIEAQQFGQWSWDAGIGTVARGWQTRQNDFSTQDARVRNLSLQLGLTGFIIHPAIAEFRLGVDALFSKNDGGIDGDSVGYRGRIRLLPRSWFPTELFASTERYDYKLPEDLDPRLVSGIPDQTKRQGFRMRLRRGILGGSAFGFEQSRVDYADPGEASDAGSRAFFDWVGGSKKLQHNYSVERSTQDYGRLDYKLDDLTVTVGEHGTIRGDLRWDLTTTAFRRDFSYGADLRAQTSTVRIDNRIAKSIGEQGALTLQYSGGLVSSDAGTGATTHRLYADYRRSIDDGWTIVPYVAANLMLSDAVTTRAPEAGIQTIWTRSFGATTATGSASAGFVLIDRTLDDHSMNSRNSTVSLAWRISHEAATGLGSDLELSTQRGSFRTVGDAVEDLPDLGRQLLGDGFEDLDRARFTMRKHWASTSIGGWLEWQHRKSTESVSRDIDVRDLTWTLQCTNRFASIETTGGSSTIEQDGPQTIRFIAAGASLAVRGGVRLHASYSRSQRTVSLGPDLDLDRSQGGVEIALGLLSLNMQVFESTERSAGNTFRSRGFTATMGRRFGGWLPIVSAPRRRGVIE